jgi:tripartite ATP-independent transporter DctM subunit
MEWQYAFALLLGGFFLLILARIPVAFAFLFINMVCAFILWGDKGFTQLVLNLQSTVGTFALFPMPLFVLMGELLFNSGVAMQAVDALAKILGRLPGRLSLLVIVAGALLGMLSGSSTASTAVLGSTFFDHMKKLRYSDAMSIGPIIGSGGLAIMIPPSSLAIILASLAYISAGKLLIAIIIPGFLLWALYSTYIIVGCTLKPSLAPRHEISKTSLIDKLKSAVFYILPLGTIIFFVTGTIFIGFATPSEAAALGVLSSVGVVALYRKLNWDLIKRSLINTARITVMIFIIIAGATTFGQVLGFTRITEGFLGLAKAFPFHPILMVVVMQLLLIILGCFLEAASMLTLSLPIFMPIINSLGIDPIWFGVVILLNTEMATTTPPFGLNLFVMKALSPQGIAMQKIYAAGLPFLVCDGILMVLLFVFPRIALWLPSLMGQ